MGPEGGRKGRSRVFAVLAAGGAVLIGLGVLRARFLAPRPPPPAAVPLSLPGVLDQAGQAPLRPLGFAGQELEARAAVVLDAASGEVTFGHRAFEPLPIASLTKLMSAIVALDRNPNLDGTVTILPEEYTPRGGNLSLSPAERVTVRDLLFASITGSANNAARALPRVLGVSAEEFVRDMNRKAIALGLESLHFADPAGYSPENVGTAYDVARLAAEALNRYPIIALAARVPSYRFRGSQVTGREHVIRNSNPIFGELAEGTESKTGYLDEALFCLVLTRPGDGGRMIAVLLGHSSEHGVVEEALSLLEREAKP